MNVKSSPSSLGTYGTKQEQKIKQFRFIGTGRLRQGKLAPLSEGHDEAMAELQLKEHRN